MSRGHLHAYCKTQGGGTLAQVTAIVIGYGKLSATDATKISPLE